MSKDSDRPDQASKDGGDFSTVWDRSASKCEAIFFVVSLFVSRTMEKSLKNYDNAGIAIGYRSELQ